MYANRLRLHTAVLVLDIVDVFRMTLPEYMIVIVVLQGGCVWASWAALTTTFGVVKGTRSLPIKLALLSLMRLSGLPPCLRASTRLFVFYNRRLLVLLAHASCHRP